MRYWDIPVTAGCARPDATAIVSPAGSLTWAELNERVLRVAGFVMGLGLGQRPRIGVLLRNGPWQPQLYYGISRAGGVVVPLNWRLTDGELRRTIEDAQLACVLAGEDVAAKVPEAARTIVIDGAGAFAAAVDAAPPLQTVPDSVPDDVTMIAYTSGTTGLPKGVMHSHRTLVSAAVRIAAEMRVQRDEAFYTCLPMFFAAAHSSMSAPLLRGCTLVIDDFSPASFLDAIERHGVSATIMVPTMVSHVLAEIGEDVRPLRRMARWGYAGAAMPPRVLQTAMDRLGPVFAGYYGQVETALTGLTLLPEDHVPARLRATGLPTIGTELRIVDVDSGADVPPTSRDAGELWIRTPSAMLGYWGRPELTRERLLPDGWLRTGDVGFRDDGGFVHLVDRLTDMIITGGINVFPREIEDVLARDPRVRESAVVGMPSDEWGELVVACVVPAPGAADRGLGEDLIALCRRELAGYKVPRQVVIRGDLPLTGSGKVAKTKLKALLA